MGAKQAKKSVVSATVFAKKMSSPLMLDCSYPTESAAGKFTSLPFSKIRKCQFLDLENLHQKEEGNPFVFPCQEHFNDRMLTSISPDETVYCYAQDNMMHAGRAWFLLQAYGVKNSFILDGLAAQHNNPEFLAEFEKLNENYKPKEGEKKSFQLDGKMFVSMTELMELIKEDNSSLSIIDSRPTDKIQMELSGGPGERKLGIIPNAKSVFPLSNFQSAENNQLLLPKEKLLDSFHAKGIELDKQIVVYCMTGFSASLNYAVLKELGATDVKLYSGSWKEWSSNPETIELEKMQKMQKAQKSSRGGEWRI